MKERPILFSGAMIRALLAGTKTQTRRVAKGVAAVHATTGDPLAKLDSAGPRVPCPYGIPGDRLWARETFIHEPADYCWEVSTSVPCRPAETVYRADHVDARGGPWKSPIHMPRWASRITLEITGVRVERLQDISEADAVAEGIETEGDEWRDYLMPHTQCCLTPRGSYRTLWEQINGPGSWEANPWVWVVEFRRVA